MIFSSSKNTFARPLESHIVSSPSYSLISFFCFVLGTHRIYIRMCIWIYHYVKGKSRGLLITRCCCCCCSRTRLFGTHIYTRIASRERSSLIICNYAREDCLTDCDDCVRYRKKIEVKCGKYYTLACRYFLMRI